MKNELSKAEKLKNKSIDELWRIARLRRIKNTDNLTKEDLINSLLKSESSPVERNYMKYFNNSTSDHKIKGKVNDIRIILSRLGNIVTKNDKKKTKKELYEIEKKQNFSDGEKEDIYDHLVELVNTLNEKEKYQYNDRDDLNYYVIKDMKHLFTNDDDNDDNYYKPIFVKRSLKMFKNTMKAEEIKTKNYQ